MRLQVALSRAGITSRRKAVTLIAQGKVKVNGRVVRQPSHSVNPNRDRIQVSDKELSFTPRVYILLNKPRGVTSTVSDPHAEKTVLDLLPKGTGRLWPVGRLDKESTGLMLLTNDGEITYRLTHPGFLIKKRYLVTLNGEPGKTDIERLKKGVVLDDKKTSPCEVRRISRARFSIVIHEGRKRQIRRMFKTIGYPVKELKRVSLGPLRLGNLREGRFRRLKQVEVQSLQKVLGK